MPREPYPPPRHPDAGSHLSYPPRNVCFMHPGYSPGSQRFLMLPAADSNGTLHHETARVACALIAGNRFDGFLSLDLQGQRPVDRDTELPLTGTEYFFQVPHVEGGLDQGYAVYPSFSQWSPPLDLPAYWRRCSIPSDPPHPMPRATGTQVVTRDVSCRVTQNKEATETAHIVQTSLRTWFVGRELDGIAELDDPSNAILLRSDVHTIWDSGRWTIIPRLVDDAAVLVAHVFRRDCSEEIVKLFHDVRLQPLYGVSVQFLFIRFAWTIFKDNSLQNFLERGVKRHLRLRASEGNDEDQWCSAGQCSTYTARSRSASPVKRSRTLTASLMDEVQQQSTEISSLSSSCTTTITELSGFTSSGHENRGRKRRRTSSVSSFGRASVRDWGAELDCARPTDSPSEVT